MWQVSEFPPFFRLSDSPLYGRTTLYLFIHPWTLGRFHGLAVVSRATVNVAHRNLFKFLLSVLLGTYPEVGLLDRTEILCLSFFVGLGVFLGFFGHATRHVGS